MPSLRIKRILSISYQQALLKRWTSTASISWNCIHIKFTQMIRCADQLTASQLIISISKTLFKTSSSEETKLISIIKSKNFGRFSTQLFQLLLISRPINISPSQMSDLAMFISHPEVKSNSCLSGKYSKQYRKTQDKKLIILPIFLSFLPHISI